MKEITPKQQQKAIEWYEAHKHHVDQLVRTTLGYYPPTLAEDKNNPSWWKGEHWKWFLKMCL